MYKLSMAMTSICISFVWEAFGVLDSARFSTNRLASEGEPAK